jgi:hypothetical protein
MAISNYGMKRAIKEAENVLKVYNYLRTVPIGTTGKTREFAEECGVTVQRMTQWIPHVSKSYKEHKTYRLVDENGNDCGKITRRYTVRRITEHLE